jgi:hypothetical protein
MPPSGHPGVVTGLGCPLCDGSCRHPWTIGAVADTYPFLPKEMVDAMQPAEQTNDPAPAPDTPVRGRRRGADRAHRPGENAAHNPGEDRS